MFKLFVFTILMLVVIYQPYVAGASTKVDANTALDRLMKKIDEVTILAQIFGDTTLKNLKAEAADLKDGANTKLHKNLQALTTIKNELVARAKAGGLNVAECHIYLDDFTTIPVTFAQKLKFCTSQQISTAEDLIEDALNCIKIAKYELSITYKNAIKDCHGSRAEKAKCDSDIAKDILEKTRVVPIELLGELAEVTYLINDLQKCLLDQLAQARKQAVKDVDNFATCVTYVETK